MTITWLLEKVKLKTTKTIGFVNAKKWVNGQSVPRMQLYDYVSYSLHVGKVIRSQVGPKNSHNELSAKEKEVRESGSCSPIKLRCLS